MQTHCRNKITQTRNDSRARWQMQTRKTIRESRSLFYSSTFALYRHAHHRVEKKRSSEQRLGRSLSFSRRKIVNARSFAPKINALSLSLAPETMTRASNQPTLARHSARENKGPTRHKISATKESRTHLYVLYACRRGCGAHVRSEPGKRRRRRRKGIGVNVCFIARAAML